MENELNLLVLESATTLDFTDPKTINYLNKELGL
jgi:hypothetical protein